MYGYDAQRDMANERRIDVPRAENVSEIIYDTVLQEAAGGWVRERVRCVSHPRCFGGLFDVLLWNKILRRLSADGSFIHSLRSVDDVRWLGLLVALVVRL